MQEIAILLIALSLSVAVFLLIEFWRKHKLHARSRTTLTHEKKPQENGSALESSLEFMNLESEILLDPQMIGELLGIRKAIPEETETVLPEDSLSVPNPIQPPEAVTTDCSAEDAPLEKVDRVDRIDRVETAGSSVIGCRQEQQDYLRIPETLTPEQRRDYGVLCVLCDGMGGMSGGELASKCCGDSVFEGYYARSSAVSPPDYFREAISHADHAVAKLTDAAGNPLDAGTTLVCAAILKNQLYWTSVGDSRAYLMRGEEILCITRDHNYLLQLSQEVKAGHMDWQTALNDPKKEALISYIGMDGIDTLDLTVSPLELMENDAVILCSDGLYKALTTAEIGQIVREATSAEFAAHMLTASAFDKDFPHQDNTSAIVLFYHASEHH